MFAAIAALVSFHVFADVVCYEYMTISGTANSQASGVYTLTDYVPKRDTVIRAKYSSASNGSSNNNQFLFCSRKEASSSATAKHFSYAANVSGKFRWDYYGPQYAASSTFEANADYELEVKNGKATITKVSDSSATTLGPDVMPDFEPQYKMCLFQSYAVNGTSYQGWGNAFRGRFYYLKAFEIVDGEETLVHWFVPCLDDSTVKICDLADGNRLYTLTCTSSGKAEVGGSVVTADSLTGSLALGDPAGSSIPVSVKIGALGEDAASVDVSVQVSTDAEFTDPVSTSLGTVTESGLVKGRVTGLILGTAYYARLVLENDLGEVYTSAPKQFTAVITPLAIHSEVKTVPYVCDTSFTTWKNQNTTNPDAVETCLFKNLKLTDIISFSANSYRAFGSNGFACYPIDGIHTEKPVQATRNNYDHDGFYFWEVAEDGQSATLQVQTKAHNSYSGQLLGVEFVKFRQVGDDVWGCVRGMKYCYNNADYGDDCTGKSNSNACKYYYDTDSMNSGHATFNFSLQDLTAYIYPPTGDFTVTFVDAEGGILDEQTVASGYDAVAPVPPEVPGYVFYGWSQDYTDVRCDLTVVAVYHRLCTVNFLNKDDSVYRTVTGVEEAKTMSADDIPEGPAAEGFAFKCWAVDLTVVPVAPDENGVVNVAPVYNRLCTVNFLNKDDSVYRTVTGVEETKTMSADDIPEGPVAEGFVFKRWATDLTVTAVTADKNGIVNVTPVYNRLCTVNFLGENGSVYQTVRNVEENVVMPAELIPADPQGENYFAGWSPDPTVTPIVADENGIAVVTSVFIPMHTVIFKKEYGEILKEELVPEGDDATPPDATQYNQGRSVFVGWIGDYRNVTSNTVVLARFIPVKPEHVDAEYPMQTETQVLFKDAKLKDVVGVGLSVTYRYGGNPGKCWYTNECSSLEAPLAEGGIHDGTGIYDFKKTDDAITFEFRGINTVGGTYSGLASAFKWRLRQDGNDIVGEFVWFHGGGNSDRYIGMESWDSVKLLYDFGFHMNSDTDNYSAKILDMQLYFDISNLPTVIILR